MHEPTSLNETALRYAARDLPQNESDAFEVRLAGDQLAREALAEAVRLSAAALGQEPPAPDRSLRSLIGERIRGCTPAWLARRAYRGHPLTWAGIGAGVAGAAALYALQVAAPVSEGGQIQTAVSAQAAPISSESQPAARGEDGLAVEPVAAETCDDARTAAEIWADLSTPEHVEKTHDDEARLHLRLKNLHTGHPIHPHE